MSGRKPTRGITRDFTRGQRAQIAVMGPDLNQNISILRLWERRRSVGRKTGHGGNRPRCGRRRGGGDPNAFKLIGSIWSPAPWLKVAKGNTI